MSFSLRKEPILNLPRTQSTYYSTNDTLVQNNSIPAEIKSSNLVFKFETKIKNLGNIDLFNLHVILFYDSVWFIVSVILCIFVEIY